jgi:alpha-methylacyl-CoA racemase
VGGVLKGLKVLEISSIGPGPFCAMMLADQGADVITIDRPGGHPMAVGSREIMRRSRRSIALDLKDGPDRAILLKLIGKVDILVEGFRPGVMERLGFGPDECLAINPKLVYVRVTGWGRDGPLADRPGHDLNYLGLAGAVYHFGRAGEKPIFPANLLGDYGAGGMLAAFGAICGAWEASRSGQGQVVDASMLDGAALMMTLLHEMRANGRWDEPRGRNILDSGAHFYEVYETKDGEFISVAAAEPQFYRRLISLVAPDSVLLAEQGTSSTWPEQKLALEAIFRTRTRNEWCDLLADDETCVAPILSMDEAPEHPHNLARGTFLNAFDLTQAAPAPRFGRSGNQDPSRPPEIDSHRAQILAEFDIAEVD